MATYEEWDECDACEGTGRTEGCVLESRCMHCQGHGSKRYIRCTECDSTGFRYEDWYFLRYPR